MRLVFAPAALLIISQLALAGQTANHADPAIRTRIEQDQQAIPQFREAPCPFQADAKVLAQFRCGSITVPENRTRPNGRQVEIGVAIVKSLSPTPRPDPVVLLPGGPAARVLGGISDRVARGNFDALRADRDLIAFDQRGVRTICPQLSAEWLRLGQVAAGALWTLRRDALTRCGNAMRSAGLDWSQYNSMVTIQDLEDLRRALGYRQWNLYSASYDTRLALYAMRSAPGGIRSVVLSAPLAPNRAQWYNRPLDMMDVVGRVSAACAAQAACAAAFPNVEQTFWQAYNDLNSNPMTIGVTRPNATRDSVRVTGNIIARIVYQALYERSDISLVPMFIHAARSRNGRAIDVLNQQIRDPERVQSGGGNTGLQYSIQCFEDAPLNTPELLANVRRSAHNLTELANVFPNPGMCEFLHPFRASPEQARPVTSEIPTLIITGEFDTATHRWNAPLIAPTLRNSRLIEIPGAGHNEALQHECTRSLVRGFFNDPQRTLNAGCLTAIPPIRFLTDFSL